MAPTIGCTPAFLAAAQNCITTNRLASSVTATAGMPAVRQALASASTRTVLCSSEKAERTRRWTNSAWDMELALSGWTSHPTHAASGPGQPRPRTYPQLSPARSAGRLPTSRSRQHGSRRGEPALPSRIRARLPPRSPTGERTVRSPGANAKGATHDNATFAGRDRHGAGLVMTGAADAAASNLVALTGDRTLLTIDSSPAVVRRVNVSASNGQLLGIDFRPADGKLYGLLANGAGRHDQPADRCRHASGHAPDVPALGSALQRRLQPGGRPAAHRLAAAAPVR